MLTAFEAATDKSPTNLKMNHLIPTANRRTGIHFLPVCTPHTDAVRWPRWQHGWVRGEGLDKYLDEIKTVW